MPGTKVVAAGKRGTQAQLIQNASSSLGLSNSFDGATNQYLKADAKTIVAMIEKREPGWTASAVVGVYIQRAIQAHKATNCLTEVMFEHAISEAKKLDEEFEKTGRLKGPLHGVPFSAKDLFQFKGFDATIGYSTFANKPADETCEIIQVIEDAGGILITKTNVPQTMLSFECCNPVWGRTLHPLSVTADSSGRLKSSKKTPPEEITRPFTSGGSSGGESALVACDGAAFGLGTDIGGSLRIPTGWCGVYALKPTPGRTSGHGQADPAPGFDAITVCQGPIGRSVDDIELVSRLLFGYGHCKVPLKYREDSASTIKGRKLKFGYYLSDGVIKASPACQRAVKESVDALIAQGHECVAFDPPDVDKAMSIFIGLTSADSYKTVLSHLGPDKMDDSLFLVTLGPKLPGSIRKIGSWAAQHVLKDSTFAELFSHARPRSVREYLKVTSQRDFYIAMWEKEVWNKYQFDGIICPVLASPAFPHHSAQTLSPLAVGTILYNVIKSSVGIVPVTRVDPTKDQITEEWAEGSKIAKKLNSKKSKFRLAEKNPSGDPEKQAPASTASSTNNTGRHGSAIIEEDLYTGALPGLGNPNKTYDPDKMAGLPVSVQIVGREMEDEKVIEMMRVVDDALRKIEGQPRFGPGSSEIYFPSTIVPSQSS